MHALVERMNRTKKNVRKNIYPLQNKHCNTKQNEQKAGSNFVQRTTTR